MFGLFFAASWSSVIFTLHCKTKQCKTERMFWEPWSHIVLLDTVWDRRAFRFTAAWRGKFAT